MAGVATDVCLVYPAISASHEGYRVQAVMDASGSPFDISEEMARRRMEREGVVLTATNTLMAELAQGLEPARRRPVASNLVRGSIAKDGIASQKIQPAWKTLRAFQAG